MYIKKKKMKINGRQYQLTTTDHTHVKSKTSKHKNDNENLADAHLCTEKGQAKIWRGYTSVTLHNLFVQHVPVTYIM